MHPSAHGSPCIRFVGPRRRSRCRDRMLDDVTDTGWPKRDRLVVRQCGARSTLPARRLAAAGEAGSEFTLMP